jgi:hypothetical protein
MKTSFALVLLAALALPAHADDLCKVLSAVRADAPKKFESIVDRSKPDGEHRYGSKQAPADATGASVSFSSGTIDSATWEARWASKGTNAERLTALKKRVMACPFAKDLVGDGKPHATEKDAPPSAIDWKDPKAGAGVGIEILAEGKEGSSIAITVTPTK